MLIALLLCGAADAGAPPDFQAGVEGQRGYGPPVVSEDGRRVALTRWDRVGLWAWDLDTGAVETVSEARGAGFHPVWDGEELLFKAVVGGAQPEQQALRWDGEAVRVLDRGPRVGQPEPLPWGGALWARGDLLVTGDGARASALGRLGDVDLVEPDPAGERLAWVDGSGRLMVRPLAGGEARALTATGAGAHPRWSSDGALLLLHGHDGAIRVLDPDTGAVRASVEGRNARWVPGERRLVFDRVETGRQGEDPSPYLIRSSSLWSLDLEDGAVEPLLEDPALHPRYPTPLGDTGDLLFVDTRSGELWLLDDGRPRRARSAPPSETAPPPPDFTAVAVSVPYMHQLWDTPDDFDGSWSCGPTSCVQVLGAYSTLPDATITCSWPYSHSSPWGWYIPNAYSYGGYTYDAWGEAAAAWVQGAHGYICREYGGAVWAYMTAFMSQHGVSSSQVGADFSHVVSQTDAGYPMYASAYVLGYGHIIAVRGYLSSGGSAIHTLVVNDPYGNAGSGDWGNYDGEGIAYDWPGYNNGYLEIDVRQLFTAQGTWPSTSSGGDDGGGATPVDTGTPAPVDTGEPATADTGTASTPTSSDTGSPIPLEPAGAPGQRALVSELGACSAGGGATGGGLLAAIALILRRRRDRR